ncbi:MAG TPA: FAD:protein FMN transferase [Solirubrobacteraceae bacterium]|nr:FAD:protein FMN transferase [Solirubrobacteraceae bacterium]
MLLTDESTLRRAPAGLRWKALGTTVALRVREPAALERAESAVRRELDAIDLACSRFRPDSELVAVNRRAGSATRVSPLLREALSLALRGAALTDGDVDPTIGRALVLAGYDRDIDLLERPSAYHGEGSPADDCDGSPADDRDVSPAPVAPRVRVRSCPGWRAVKLVSQTGTVRLPAGVTLDLGASAKAWAADRAAAAAAKECACGVLVGIGGDVATAGAPPPDGWEIRVTDDHRSDLRAPGQTVTIRSGGLATSSTAVRRWRHEGRAMHHIIDPATGEPVRGTWRTVSVAAGSCADANIAATAAMVRAAAAKPWLEQLGLPARMVAADGSVTRVAGWPR